MPTSQTPIILLVLGIVILAAAGYLLLSGNEEEGVVSSGAPASQAELEFLNLTAQLEPIGFNTAILSDPRFQALQDIRTAILPEPSGRPDPFAPLGGN